MNELWKKVIAFALIAVLAVTSSTAIYAYTIFSHVSDSDSTIDQDNVSALDNLDTDVLNIALFGLDGRSDVDGDRSDVIMVCSVNFVDGTIKVTSVLRDTMVQIPETENTYASYEKINAAYNYGGSELAIKTLNENFDLNITDFVAVDFDCVVDTVDAIGGIEVNVENEDVLYWTNQYIMDVNDKVNKHEPFLTHTGVQQVNGVQALAFCRNRYSDNDQGRTRRQREVLEQMATKAFSMDSLSLLGLAGQIYPYLKTSFSLQEISTYGKAFLSLENKQFIDFRLPTDDLSYGGYSGDVWFLFPNSLADNAIVLHKFLYGEDGYQPSEYLMNISYNIASYSGLSGGITIDTTLPFEAFISPSDDGTAEPTPQESTIPEGETLIPGEADVVETETEYIPETETEEVNPDTF